MSLAWIGGLLGKLDGKPDQKIVCPGCGNRDYEEMRLFIVGLEWDRYYFIGHLTEDKAPIFEYGKGVYSESSPDHNPIMGCDKCDGEWEVDWNDFDLN